MLITQNLTNNIQNASSRHFIRMKLTSQASVSKFSSPNIQKTQNNTEDALRSRRSSINTKITQSQHTNRQFTSIDTAKLEFKRLLQKSDQLKQQGIQSSQIKTSRINQDVLISSKLFTDINMHSVKHKSQFNGAIIQKNQHKKDKSLGQVFKSRREDSNAKNQPKTIDSIINTIVGSQGNQPKNAESIIKSVIQLGESLKMNNQYHGTEYFKDKLIKITSIHVENSLEFQNKNSTSLWLGQVYDKCTSSAFKHYICHDLDYSQTKSYCCQQIIYNLLEQIRRRNKSLTKNLRDSDTMLKQQIQKYEKKKIIYQTQPMKFINEESGKILSYLCSKYPQTNVQGVNKQVAQIVETIKIDNWANDEYDLMRLSGVKFTYKESGDYSPEIMKFLNFLMQLPLTPHKRFPNLTNYKFFEQVMRKIFSVVFIKDANNDISHILNQKDEINLENKPKSNMTEQQSQYYERIKKQTTILIGCKIPSTARHFSREDIESGIIKVEDNAISRVIDKWAQQLGSKFFQAESLILNRNYRFKAADSFKLYKIPKENRLDLFKILQEKKKDIEEFIKELKESLYDLSGKLAINTQSDLSDINFLDQTQKMFGEFAVKMSQSNSQYFIQILQKQINLLLESVETLKQRWVIKNKFKQSPVYQALNISLITFKIGDLFRCKIISNENQIARVLKVFMTLSEMWGNKLIKIIRVKNRLQSGTRDVLINFMFDEICPCEIQLAVAQKIQQKQGYFDKFNHFLYELKRAYLGPVMEMCKIWRQYEGKSQTYSRIIQKSIKNKIKKKKISKQLKQSHLTQNSIIFEYKFPFICSSCQIFYPQSNLIYFTTLISGKIYCGNCCKLKIALETQNTLEAKKIFIFRKYLSRYPNFHKMMNYFYELTNLSQMISHKYQVHIPFFSRIIHMHYALMLKLERSANQVEQFDYDEYVFVTTKMTEQGKVVKEVCSEKIAKVDKNNSSSLKSLMSIDEASETINQNYIFYGWNVPTKLLPLPEISTNHYLQMIQKFIPHLQLLQQQKEYQNLKICAVQVEEGKYYYLPLFIMDEQEISVQVLKQNNIEYIMNSVDKREQVLEIQNKEMTTEWLELPINVKLKIAYTLKEIYLNNNNIRSSNFIETFHGLKVFHAENNSIEQVPKIPAGLEQLNLSFNKIQAINQFIPYQNAEKQYNLATLLLGSNPISKIQNISHIKSLKVLFLGRCKLKKLEGLPENVEALGLPFNQIQRIQNLQKLTNLKRLGLIQNLINKIENLEKCKSLQFLLLSRNNICRIENLEELTNLQALHLSFTGLLSDGPKTCMYYKGLKGLKKLKRLIVEGNKIQCLLQMTGLSYEDFYNKNYLNISFIEMRELIITQNEITYLHGIDKFMPFLETINISKNQVIGIDDVLNLSSLTWIDASFNRIEKLPETGWEKNFKLKLLNLSNNHIKVVPDLGPLIFLKCINFENNRITRIQGFPRFPFGQSDLVRVIKFDKNCLFEQQTSPQDFEKTLESLKLLNPQSMVSMLDNGYSRQKIYALHSKKQEYRLQNMLVPELPLLTDSIY